GDLGAAPHVRGLDVATGGDGPVAHGRVLGVDTAQARRPIGVAAHDGPGILDLPGHGDHAGDLVADAGNIDLAQGNVGTRAALPAHDAHRAREHDQHVGAEGLDLLVDLARGAGA